MILSEVRSLVEALDLANNFDLYEENSGSAEMVFLIGKNISRKDFEDYGFKVKEVKAGLIIYEVPTNLCIECGRELGEPRYEGRDEEHIEKVYYCPCGATYTS